MKLLQLDPCHAFKREYADSVVTLVDQYEWTKEQLFHYDAFIVPEFVDQEFLWERRSWIEEFLQEGKTVFFFGHLFKRWLPHVAPFMPKRLMSHHDYEVTRRIGAPIFQHVVWEDVLYKRGVAGFFARGYYPVSSNAEILLTFRSGEVVTFIDRTSTKGTIFVHAGRNLFDLRFDTTSGVTIYEELIAWLKEEIR